MPEFPEPDSYDLNISVTVERLREGRLHTGERISVTQNLKINVSSFLEIAKVLGQFHDLTETLNIAAKQNAHLAATLKNAARKPV